MKDELGGKIMIEFVKIRQKKYFLLKDYGNDEKKAKRTKKYVIKRILKFEDYKNCLQNNKIAKLQQIFKSEEHNVFIKEINEIALSSNDDKKLQIFDRITLYPYGTNTGKVCKSELLNVIPCNIYKYKMINFVDVTNES